MDLRIRHADDRDCSTIVSLVRATLQDMEAVGGDPINQDKNFWKMYADNIVELIRKDDRLYLLAQAGSRSIGFLEGNINNAAANKLYKKLGFKVFQYALRMNLP
jgi:hypothetical protein